MKLSHHFCLHCNARIPVAEMGGHLQFECPVLTAKRNAPPTTEGELS